MAMFAPAQPQTPHSADFSTLRQELVALIQDFHLSDDISLERMFDRIEETENRQ
ncbi:hypothetical protein BVG79_01993 [Ketogulonicigenium robustum]|uniref:Uncharacterized protein n=1 Tax=Ketogulonicigenium robustum TaxID=92947 RepID=A0A1W6P1F2_9RHOB|nr:hypothetical protein [Ketogulonicigenium robustum]ARO15335.1 hypothetical protein BVG79_01993 [Ketogulonicigenium robustum]